MKIAGNSYSTKEPQWRVIVSSIHILQFYVVKFEPFNFFNGSWAYGFFLNFYSFIFYLQIYDQPEIYFDVRAEVKNPLCVFWLSTQLS